MNKSRFAYSRQLALRKLASPGNTAGGFFGGYDFSAADISRSPAVAGYAKGVPMGAERPAAPAGKASSFLVAALKDPPSGRS